MTTLHELYERQGQSPWLDNLRRDFLRKGTLASLVAEGIRGVTSNPTIFAKAIQGETDYDEQFADLLATRSVEEAYWEMVVTDIEGALELLRPVHDGSSGEDGFVSIEVAPALARDTGRTVEAARGFHLRIGAPNLYVKIPGTSEGIPAIREMVAEGRNINVTLLFSLERYRETIEAYISGLEQLLAAGRDDLSGVRSVASFFVSRVDTEVDRRLESSAVEADEAGSSARAEHLRSLRGTAAVAQARQAYQLFVQGFSGPRWEALAARGANVQRPLWASTSTKNPAYPDLAYVEPLIGPDTVNTMPDQTIDAFLDHGTVERTVDAPRSAERPADVLAQLGEAGVDMADVARTLEAEGVASFAKSFDGLMEVLEGKARALRG